MFEATEVDKVYVALLSVRGTTVSFFSVDPVAMDSLAVCKLVLADVCAVDDDGVGVTEAEAVGAGVLLAEADAVGAGVLLAVGTGVLLAVGAGVLLAEVDVE